MAAGLFWIGQTHNGDGQPPPWNNGSGDPVRRIGGIPFSSPFVPGVPLALIANGTGDAQLALNGGPGFAWRNAPPFGYTLWPNAFFDPATAQGSATLNNPFRPDLVDFPAIPGLIETIGSSQAGAYYFEYTITGLDLFSNSMGVGIGRRAPQLPSWFGGGQFSPSDTYGGVQVDGGFNNTWKVRVSSNGVFQLELSGVSDAVGVILAVAVLITETSPPAHYTPQGFDAVSLVCVPCAPLSFDPKWPISG